MGLQDLINKYDNGGFSKTGWFQLKDDGDTATVRLLHKGEVGVKDGETDYDFPIYEVHKLDVDGNVWWDTNIAGWVLNENEKHGLKPMYNKYILNGEGSDEDFGDLFEGIPCNYIPIDIFAIYGANDGFKTWALYQFQKKYLREDHPRADYRKLYYSYCKAYSKGYKATG